MSELSMVQVNQAVQQPNTRGNSERRSENNTDFSEYFNKATEQKSQEPVRNENRRESGRNENKGNSGRTERNSHNEKTQREKKAEEEKPSEELAAQAAGPQNNTVETPAEKAPAEETAATEGVTEVNNNQSVENELAAGDEAAVSELDLPQGSDENTVDVEVTIDEEAVNAFKKHLQGHKKGHGDENSVHSGRGDRHDVKGENKIDISNENNMIIEAPENSNEENVEELIKVEVETNIQAPKEPVGFAPALIQMEDIPIKTDDEVADSKLKNEIIEMEKALISEYPELEDEIDMLTKNFLKANPNPTIEESAAFFKSITGMLENAQKAKLDALNNKVTEMETNMNLMATQMNTVNFNGELSVQETVSDLSTNLQRMFVEIANSAQMTAPGTTSQLVLQLYPEHLGKLRIQLTADLDGKISARMESGNAAVRALLNSGLSDLIDCLKASGVDLKALEVGKLEMELSNSDLGHSNMRQNNQQNDQNRQYNEQKQSTITRVMAANPRMLTSALYNTAVANSYVDENVSVEFSA